MPPIDSSSHLPSSSYTLYTHTGGDLETNAYILSLPNPKNQTVTLCFDAPQDTLRTLQKLSLTPQALILTHGHFDHITDAAAIAETYHCPIYIHPADQFMIENPSIFTLWGVPPISPVKNAQPLNVPDFGSCETSIATIPMRLFHIPGHSPGSLAFYLPEHQLLFAGDILFAGSIGRWDLPGGNQHHLLNGIRQHLLTLPDSTRVLPGHGPTTLIEIERKQNPFLIP